MLKVDNNKLITLEEAQNILKFAKRIYTGRFDGVTIELSDEFAYYPNQLKITIAEEFADEAEENTVLDILKHVNNEFNADFDINLRSVSIQALLHEMGHHIDFDGKMFTGQFDDYMEENCFCRAIFSDLSKEFSNRVDDYYERLLDLSIEEKEDEEIIFEMKEKEIELVEFEKFLDDSYRRIPAEYAADEFSARFFMTYLRGYKKCNYQVC